ncbi:TPA: DegT/DnrJ/EryC1/StrS family aminotransferase [Stenotrophomonas maltophilia]|uniref:DegT/DnrJ/EryC1/StrS family aminotransferase n=1 Tax=Stenotrophomonas maltophilia group TaxID=995085 RepID=UPI000AB8F3C8|nr:MULTISPECIES: DegT/DnrJ/EryC1/StrS family aminotransferase [Stenotrophomonas]
MEIQFIDLAAQYRALKQDVDARIAKVLEHGRYIMGPEVREMEQALEARTGAPHCISVASGTEALLIALMAIGVSAGDEVITTSFTFVATAEVIALLGAVPVFVDVEPDTCNIDANLIEAAITPRTKAIIPVSLYGQVADMDAINAIAARHPGITVIEDAAQSFGATYRGKASCNVSRIACTSFFPSKPLGCYGDGGAIFTDDAALAKAMAEIRVHGQERRYYHTRVGVGGRMDTLQCAIVLAKLGRFDFECERRQHVAGRYLQALAGLQGCELPSLREGNSSVWGQFTVQVDDRAKVVERLTAANVPTAVHYPVPLHQQPAYRDRCRIASSLANSERVAQRVMSLPMSADLDETQQDYIIEQLRAALRD